MTKVLKKKKLRRARKRAPLMTLQPGQTVVVETLSTSSVADVVWQVRKCELPTSDGSVANDSGFLGHALFCWVSSSLSFERFYCLHCQGQGVFLNCSTLKLEAVQSFKVLETAHKMAQCCIPDDLYLCLWASCSVDMFPSTNSLLDQALDIRPHWTENCRLKNLRQQQVFFCATAFGLVQGPISLLALEYLWCSCWSVRLASHFHLLASLKWHWAIPPLQRHGHSMTLKYRASAPFTFS